MLNDDQSIVWATWTNGTDGSTPVIRMYNVLSGKRKLVALGESPNTWWYTWASISGNRVVCEKASSRYSQILLTDLSTGKTQPLTPASAENSQPCISADLVAWEDGAQFSQGKGVVVRNLQTGKQVEFHAFDAQGPRALAGRSVVWVHGNRTSEAS